MITQTVHIHGVAVELRTWVTSPGIDCWTVTVDGERVGYADRDSYGAGWFLPYGPDLEPLVSESRSGSLVDAARYVVEHWEMRRREAA